jgi:hypothetical protein
LTPKINTTTSPENTNRSASIDSPKLRSLRPDVMPEAVSLKTLSETYNVSIGAIEATNPDAINLTVFLMELPLWK